LSGGKLLGIGLGALALKLLVQAALTAAIVLAPNAVGASRPASLPAALSSRGGRALRVGLGPGESALATWIVEARDGAAKGTIVLFHGVRMNKSSLEPIAVSLSDAGYRAVLVDLPGHGESDGQLLSYGAQEAIKAANLLDVLERSVKLGPVGVYGFSYGAAVAIDWAARDPRIRAVVAVSPFGSLRDVIRDYRSNYLPAFSRFLPDAWFQNAIDDAGWLAGFDPDASAPLRSIVRTAPTLLIHGDVDTQVPLRHSRRLQQASGGRATLVVVRGATHSAMPMDSTHAIRARAIAWFDARLHADQPATTPGFR
jgi:uncharacterized protein